MPEARRHLMPAVGHHAYRASQWMFRGAVRYRRMWRAIRRPKG
jgi:hypothetical protein